MGFYLIKININYLMILSLINLFTVIFIYSRIEKKKQKWSINKKQIIGLVKVGFPIMIAGIVGELLLSTDRLLISYFFIILSWVSMDLPLIFSKVFVLLELQ